MAGMMEEMTEHQMHRPPPSKAAHFRFVHGNDMVEVKCADDESTRACVDALVTLLDKLGPMD